MIKKILGGGACILISRVIGSIGSRTISSSGVPMVAVTSMCIMASIAGDKIGKNLVKNKC